MHSSRRATRYLHLGTAQHRGLPEQAPTHSGVESLTIHDCFSAFKEPIAKLYHYLQVLSLDWTKVT